MSSSRKKKKKYRSDPQQRFIKAKRRNLLAKPGSRQIVIVLDSLKPNFNIGKIFRSADAFGIKKIHLIDTDFFDPAPAKGALRWVPAVFNSNFADCYKTLKEEGYHLFIFTPHDGESLQNIKLPERSAFIFGHEEFGYSFALGNYPDLTSVFIPQIGKVESLNVSVAASIAMFEYTRQHPATDTDAPSPDKKKEASG